jgi:hypothetical protein
MNFRVAQMRGISLLAAKPVSFSRRALLHAVSITNRNIPTKLPPAHSSSQFITAVLFLKATESQS